MAQQPGAKIKLGGPSHSSSPRRTPPTWGSFFKSSMCPICLPPAPGPNLACDNYSPSILGQTRENLVPIFPPHPQPWLPPCLCLPCVSNKWVNGLSWRQCPSWGHCWGGRARGLPSTFQRLASWWRAQSDCRSQTSAVPLACLSNIVHMTLFLRASVFLYRRCGC